MDLMCSCARHQFHEGYCTCLCPEHDDLPKDFDSFRTQIGILQESIQILGRRLKDVQDSQDSQETNKENG